MRKVRLPVRDEQQALLLGESEVHPEGSDALALLKTVVQDCRRCPRYATRKRPVLWSGQTKRPLLAFLAEAPSHEEEREGHFFVGRHGAMVDRMLQALKLTREDVFITGSLLCRGEYPFASDAEIKGCLKNVTQQMLAVRPYVIVAMGNSAIQMITGGEGVSLTSRGTWTDFGGIRVKLTMNLLSLLSPTLPTPGYYKERCWEDVQQAYDQAVLLRRRDLLTSSQPVHACTAPEEPS